MGVDGLCGSCGAGLEVVPPTVVRLGLEVRSCRAGLEGVPFAGDAAAAGGAFLPGRGVDSDGLWVLRVAFPAAPGTGAVDVFGTAPVFSRLVDRALPGLGGEAETAEPTGWG